LFLEEALVEGTREQLAFEKMGGLIPAVIQDYGNGDVLMVGFVNAESLAATQKTGEVHFFSRSRNKLWKKGETSGHILRVREIRVDCDADAVLIRVDAVGPGVCHEGYRNCFFRALDSEGKLTVVDQKVFEAESVYGKKGFQ
jgi:phosphoribosyl-AMP cyclohydrolase